MERKSGEKKYRKEIENEESLIYLVGYLKGEMRK